MPNRPKRPPREPRSTAEQVGDLATAVGAGAVGGAGGAEAAAVGAAGAAGGTAAGAAGLTASAQAATTAAILAGVVAFFRRRKARQARRLRDRLFRNYPQHRPGDLRAVVAEELDREREFQRRMGLRVERDIADAMKVEDAAKRREIVQRVLDREKRYVEMRERAMAERADARAEYLDVKAKSPKGAYWKLDPTVSQHTLDCIAMGEKFWPWEVLERIQPPLHAGCPCRLVSLDAAIAAGWMTAEMIPDTKDAIRRAKAAIEGARAVQEAAYPEEIAAYLEEVTGAEWEHTGGELEEASLRGAARAVFYGLKPGERYAPGTTKAGQFKPRRGGDPGKRIRRSVRAALTALIPSAPKTPAAAAEARDGRWAWLRGRFTYIPEHKDFKRDLDGVNFRSPPGSLNIYRDGHLVSEPGGDEDHPDLKKPPPGERVIPGTAKMDTGKEDTGVVDAAIVRGHAAREARAERAQAAYERAGRAVNALDSEKPPVQIGDQSAVVMSVLGGRDFQTIEIDAHSVTMRHMPTGSRLTFSQDRHGEIDSFNWDPGVKGVGKEKASLLDRPPENFQEFGADLMAQAAVLAERHGVGLSILDVVVDQGRADHGGNHMWDGRITLGRDVPEAILVAAQARAEGRPLDDGECLEMYESVKVGAHESLHAVNPIQPYDYQGPGKALEEALTEEYAHILTHDMLRRYGLTEVSDWAAANADQVTGTYPDYRMRLDRLFNEAHVAPEARGDMIEALKQERSMEERFSVLASLLTESGVPDGEERARQILDTRIGDNVVPLIRPDHPVPTAEVNDARRPEPGDIVEYDKKLKDGGVRVARGMLTGRGKDRNGPYWIVEGSPVLPHEMRGVVESAQTSEIKLGDEPGELPGYGGPGQRIGPGARVRVTDPDDLGGNPPEVREGSVVEVLYKSWTRKAGPLDFVEVLFDGDEQTTMLIERKFPRIYVTDPPREPQAVRVGDLIRYDGRADGGYSQAKVEGVRKRLDGDWVIDARTTDDSLVPGERVVLTQSRVGGHIEVVERGDSPGETIGATSAVEGGDPPEMEAARAAMPTEHTVQEDLGLDLAGQDDQPEDTFLPIRWTVRTEWDRDGRAITTRREFDTQQEAERFVRGGDPSLVWEIEPPEGKADKPDKATEEIMDLLAPLLGRDGDPDRPEPREVDYEGMRRRWQQSFQDAIERKAVERTPEVEMVPVEFAYRHREYDRPLSGEYDEDLIASVRKHGIVTPLQFGITKSGQVYLHEGNHRLEIARRAGMTHVPAVVNPVTRQPNVRGEAAKSRVWDADAPDYRDAEDLPKERFKVPAERRDTFRPSDVGIPVQRFKDDPAKRLEIKPTEGAKRLTRPQVHARAKQTVKAAVRFYGGEMPDVSFEPEYLAANETMARFRHADLLNGVLYGQEISDRFRDPEYGVGDMRILAHEAIHSLSGVTPGPLPGFSQTVEEGAAEIMSLWFWHQRMQPFDARDAVRRDGRWTSPGVETLAASTVYTDDVAEVMRRAASKVGWEREAIMAEVERVMRGDHGVRIKFRDETDLTDPPEGVQPTGEGLIRWLLDGVPGGKDDTGTDVLLGDEYLGEARRYREAPGTGNRFSSYLQTAGIEQGQGEGIRDAREAMAKLLGFDSVREYDEAQGQVLWDLTADAHVAVRVPPQVLDRLSQGERLLSGTHAEGTPAEAHDSETYTTSRAAWEQRVWGEGNHPVYGYMATDDEAVERNPVSGFGEIKLKMKPEVRERTWIVYSDSNYVDVGRGNAIPSPVDAPGGESVPYFDTVIGLTKLNLVDGQEPREIPESAWTPAMREVARQAAHARQRYEETGSEHWKENAEEREWHLNSLKGEWEREHPAFRRWPHGDFVEASIFGDLDLDDVEEVTIPGRLADAAVIERLREWGITVVVLPMEGKDDEPQPDLPKAQQKVMDMVRQDGYVSRGTKGATITQVRKLVERGLLKSTEGTVSTKPGYDGLGQYRTGQTVQDWLAWDARYDTPDASMKAADQRRRGGKDDEGHGQVAMPPIDYHESIEEPARRGTERAVAVIAKVAPGLLPERVSIVPLDAEDDAAGRAMHDGTTAVSPTASEHGVMNVIVHELAHNWDRRNAGDGPGEDWWTQSTAGEALSNLLWKLPTIEKIKHGDSPLIAPNERGYYTQSKEVFARAMEQHVALRSGDPDLAEHLRRWREDEHGLADNYFTDEEFAAVASTFDTMFASDGGKDSPVRTPLPSASATEHPLMGDFRVYVGGKGSTNFVSAAEAAEQVATARAQGETWDVRKRIGGRQSHRPLDNEEAQALIGLVTQHIIGKDDAPERPSAPRYERVTYTPEGGKSTSVLLRITNDTERFLSGIEVKKDGDEVVPRGEPTERQHLIDKTLVNRRTPMRMNWTYATLEEDPQGFTYSGRPLTPKMESALRRMAEDEDAWRSVALRDLDGLSARGLVEDGATADGRGPAINDRGRRYLAGNGKDDEGQAKLTPAQEKALKLIDSTQVFVDRKTGGAKAGSKRIDRRALLALDRAGLIQIDVMGMVTRSQGKDDEGTPGYEIKPADEGWFQTDGTWIPRHLGNPNLPGYDTLWDRRHGQGEGRVAYVDGKPVASVTWVDNGGAVIRLGTAYTAPEHRQRGLFNALTADVRGNGRRVDAFVWENLMLRRKVDSWGKDDPGFTSPVVAPDDEETLVQRLATRRGERLRRNMRPLLEEIHDPAVATVSIDEMLDRMADRNEIEPRARAEVEGIQARMDQVSAETRQAFARAVAANDANPIYRQVVERHGGDLIVLVGGGAAVTDNDREIGVNADSVAAERRVGYTQVYAKTVRATGGDEQPRRQGKVGTGSVKMGLAAILRHEFGHEVYDDLSEEHKREFSEEIAARERDYQVHQISPYANQSYAQIMDANIRHQEGYAEAAASATFDREKLAELSREANANPLFRQAAATEAFTELFAIRTASSWDPSKEPEWIVKLGDRMMEMLGVDDRGKDDPALTEPERSAVEDFTGQGFGHIQRVLYGVDLKPAERQPRRLAEANETIRRLDDVIARQPPLDEQRVVYHGGSVGDRLRGNVNPGYLSTSTRSGSSYARARGEGKITLTPGMKVLEVESVLGSDRHNESEVILPRGTRFDPIPGGWAARPPAEGKDDQGMSIRGPLDYRPDPTAPVEGEYVYDRNVSEFYPDGVAVGWRQDHDELVIGAIQSMKGWGSEMRLHMRDELEGRPLGIALIPRQRARALLWELRNRARPNPRTLYRGSHVLPSGLTAWSEVRSTGNVWAKRGGGELHTLPPGTARGIRVADYYRSGIDTVEREWIVDVGGKVEVVATTPEIEKIEGNYVDGDENAVARLERVNGRDRGAYRHSLRAALRRAYGPKVPLYRVTTPEEHEQLARGGYRGRSVAFQAKRPPEDAPHVTRVLVRPQAVLMRGDQVRGEYVLDGSHLEGNAEVLGQPAPLPTAPDLTEFHQATAEVRLAAAAGKDDPAIPVAPEPGPLTGIRASHEDVGRFTPSDTIENYALGVPGDGFGTGIYFVSTPEVAGSLKSRKHLHGVDLRGLRLYRPADERAGFALHDALRDLEGMARTGEHEWGPAEDTSDLDRLLHPPKNARTIAEHLPDPPASRLDLDAKAAIVDRVIDEVAPLAARYREGDKSVGGERTATPRVFLALGWDGIDTRHLERLDSTQFGSVAFRGAPEGKDDTPDFSAPELAAAHSARRHEGKDDPGPPMKGSITAEDIEMLSTLEEPSDRKKITRSISYTPKMKKRVNGRDWERHGQLWIGPGFFELHPDMRISILTGEDGIGQSAAERWPNPDPTKFGHEFTLMNAWIEPDAEIGDSSGIDKLNRQHLVDLRDAGYPLPQKVLDRLDGQVQNQDAATPSATDLATEAFIRDERGGAFADLVGMSMTLVEMAMERSGFSTSTYELGDDRWVFSNHDTGETAIFHAPRGENVQSAELWRSSFDPDGPPPATGTPEWVALDMVGRRREDAHKKLLADGWVFMEREGNGDRFVHPGDGTSIALVTTNRGDGSKVKEARRVYANEQHLNQARAALADRDEMAGAKLGEPFDPWWQRMLSRDNAWDAKAVGGGRGYFDVTHPEHETIRVAASGFDRDGYIAEVGYPDPSDRQRILTRREWEEVQARRDNAGDKAALDAEDVEGQAIGDAAKHLFGLGYSRAGSGVISEDGMRTVVTFKDHENRQTVTLEHERGGEMAVLHAEGVTSEFTPSPNAPEGTAERVAFRITEHSGGMDTLRGLPMILEEEGFQTDPVGFQEGNGWNRYVKPSTGDSVMVYTEGGWALRAYPDPPPRETYREALVQAIRAEPLTYVREGEDGNEIAQALWNWATRTAQPSALDRKGYMEGEVVTIKLSTKTPEGESVDYRLRYTTDSSGTITRAGYAPFTDPNMPEMDRTFRDDGYQMVSPQEWEEQRQDFALGQAAAQEERDRKRQATLDVVQAAIDQGKDPIEAFGEDALFGEIYEGLKEIGFHLTTNRRRLRDKATRQTYTVYSLENKSGDRLTLQHPGTGFGTMRLTGQVVGGDVRPRGWAWKPLPRQERKRLDRPPESVEEFISEALGRADELTERYNTDQTIGAINVRGGIEGAWAWWDPTSGVISIGTRLKHVMEGRRRRVDGKLKKVQEGIIEKRKRGEPLSDDDLGNLYSIYKTWQHELHHGINPQRRGEYRGIGVGIEEALVEETAQVNVQEWLAQVGEHEVLDWARRNPDSHQVMGSYQTYRKQLRDSFDFIGIPEEERRDLIFKLKFEMKGAERQEYLLRRAAEKHGVDYDEAYNSRAARTSTKRGSELRYGALNFGSSNKVGAQSVTGFQPVIDYPSDLQSVEVPNPRPTQVEVKGIVHALDSPASYRTAEDGLLTSTIGGFTTDGRAIMVEPNYETGYMDDKRVTAVLPVEDLLPVGVNSGDGDALHEGFEVYSPKDGNAGAVTAVSEDGWVDVAFYGGESGPRLGSRLFVTGNKITTPSGTSMVYSKPDPEGGEYGGTINPEVDPEVRIADRIVALVADHPINPTSLRGREVEAIAWQGTDGKFADDGSPIPDDAEGFWRSGLIGTAFDPDQGKMVNVHLRGFAHVYKVDEREGDDTVAWIPSLEEQQRLAAKAKAAESAHLEGILAQAQAGLAAERAKPTEEAFATGGIVRDPIPLVLGGCVIS